MDAIRFLKKENFYDDEMPNQENRKGNVKTVVENGSEVKCERSEVNDDEVSSSSASDRNKLRCSVQSVVYESTV